MRTFLCSFAFNLNIKFLAYCLSVTLAPFYQNNPVWSSQFWLRAKRILDLDGRNVNKSIVERSSGDLVWTEWVHIGFLLFLIV